MRRLIVLVACLAGALALGAEGDAGFSGSPGIDREAIPGAASPRRLTLTFIGDIMAHSVNLAMQDFRDIYAGVADLLGTDDLTFANLEFPFDQSQPPSGYPRFNAHREFVEAAMAAGVEVFSLANNHAFDQREEGIFQTLRSVAFIQARSPRPSIFSGTRGNPDRAPAAQALTVKGVRVGFIAVTQFLNDPQGGPFVHVVDYTDAEAAEQFIDLVHGLSSAYDLFIVSYHGDQEYVQEPSPIKRRFFLRLLESGVHIVYSHHPHVVQGFEVVRVGEVDRLVLYSLGNFVSGMTARMDPATPLAPRAPTGDSFMLSVQVAHDGGSTSVVGLTPIPVSNYRNAKGEIVVGKLRELAGGALGLPADWVAYYKARLEVMEQFLARFQ